MFASDPEQLTLDEVRQASTEAGVGSGGEQPAQNAARSDPNRTFTFQELKQIAGTGVLDNLMSFISSNEGGLEAFNRGTSSDSPGDLTGPSNREWSYIDWPLFASVTEGGAEPKKLTQLTLDEISQIQRGGNTVAVVNMSPATSVASPPSGDDKRGIFAVGRFQFVPATLRGAIANTSVPRNTLFDETTQKALGAYLFLAKPDRPSMGAYLVGKYDYVEWAAQDVAREWSSQPLQFNEAGRQTGQSRYEDLVPPHTTEQVVEALREARAAMLGNATVMGILEAKNLMDQTTPETSGAGEEEEEIETAE